MAGEATGSFRSRLTRLQQDVLSAFFAREQEFFLSGGAALAGCTPATLAWLLDQVVIPEGLLLPGGASAGELREWIGGLVQRLRRQAHPGP